jgi:hypothetical protein
MKYPIVLECVEDGLWAFVAEDSDVQIGWCRKNGDGWWVEDMDGNCLAGPSKSRSQAEAIGINKLSHLGGASNPGW